jgi:hypothetical protein
MIVMFEQAQFKCEAKYLRASRFLFNGVLLKVKLNL